MFVALHLYNFLWEDSYDMNSLDDQGTALVASANSFVVTGYVTDVPGDENILVRKYDLSGTLLWNEEIDQQGENDRGVDIIEDAEGNYLVLSDVTKEGQTDVYLYYLEGSTGSVIWSEQVSEDLSSNEKAISIESTLSGQIYVTYQTDVPAGINGQATSSAMITEAYSYGDLNFPVDGEPFSKGSFYISNSGQLRDENGQSIEGVRYYTFGMYPDYFFEDDKFSLVVSDTSQSQRVDFNFINSQPIYVGQVQEYQKITHFNYYHDLLKYEEQNTFDVLAWPEIYEGVDAFISSNSEGFKMTFVLETGADLSKIELDIEGSNGFNLSGGGLQGGLLEMQTVTGNLSWLEPFSYSQNVAEIIDDDCIEYQIVEGNLKFFSHCELSYPYVIQVKAGEGQVYGVAAIDNMDWSTFWGGTGDDGCHDVEADDAGNLYIAGFAHGSTLQRFPNTLDPAVLRTGAGLIAKFDHNGVNRWNTFIQSSLGTLGSNATPSVAIKGVGKFNSSTANSEVEIHFVGEYMGMLTASINNSVHVPPTAYKQPTGTIDEDSRELMFGTVSDNNGSILMITPFGGDDVEEVYAMDISTEGLMYFAGSTESDGDKSAHGSRTHPSGHTFPVFDPQDGSVFLSTHPTPNSEFKGFVSVIDLNPASSNHYQLAYSSIITSSSGYNPYRVIYDIVTYPQGVSFCGRGTVAARLGYFDRGKSPSIFTPNLDHQWSSRTDRTYFCSVVPPEPGSYGGYFMGSDISPDQLLAQNLSRNQYQTTTGDAYIIHIEDDIVRWDTWFGQTGIQDWHAAPTLTYLHSVPFYHHSISGRGSLSYIETQDPYAFWKYSTLFAAGSVSGSPVETKVKNGYFTETTIDQNTQLADIYITAFSDDYYNTKAFNWGTIFGGEGPTYSNLNQTHTIGKDFLSDIESYKVNDQAYTVSIACSFSKKGNTTSDVEKYPVAQLPVTNTYFNADNHNTSSQLSMDITITRFKVTDIMDVVSIKEPQLPGPIKIYPNPGSEIVNISLEGEDEIKGLKLVDLKGRLLLKKDYIQNTGAVRLDISGISPGVYIIEINGQYAEQLVKY